MAVGEVIRIKIKIRLIVIVDIRYKIMVGMDGDLLISVKMVVDLKEDTILEGGERSCGDRVDRLSGVGYFYY